MSYCINVFQCSHLLVSFIEENGHNDRLIKCHADQDRTQHVLLFCIDEIQAHHKQIMTSELDVGSLFSLCPLTLEAVFYAYLCFMHAVCAR